MSQSIAFTDDAKLLRNLDKAILTDDMNLDTEMVNRAETKSFLSSSVIDNHDSGYLGMAVQLYVHAYFGHYHILIQRDYRQKLMAQLKSTPHFTYMCII